MKNIKTFEGFINESVVNEAKLQGNEWKLWVDIEEMINDLKSKYSGKVAKGKIKEFILDYVSDLNESLNEAKLKDNSYQSVLFGKLKSGKWSIIKSTDPNGNIQTKDDLYPRGNDPKYLEYCIIQDLGGNRGQSLQQDAEEHLAQLNSGKINHNTAAEKFSKIEFL